MTKTGRLPAYIAERIQRSGLKGKLVPAAVDAEEASCISFHDYMAICLYDEQDGYYRSGKIRVGKSGDFYTSSSIGTIMGEKLAAYAAALAEKEGGASAMETGSAEAPLVFMEWGAGTGLLAQQIISAWMKAEHAWLTRAKYVLVDSNPVHLGEARERLQPLADLTDSPELGFLPPEEALQELRGLKEENQAKVLVIANELLDAFPVHRIAKHNGQLWELGVAAHTNASAGANESVPHEQEPFRYVYMALTDPSIGEVLALDGIELLAGQITEVNLAAEAWITQLGELIVRGALILIDYGHEAAELTAPHRMQGTLLCYKDHMAADRPFMAPGEQDITAHVNFTACRRAAEAAGWRELYCDTQKQFLIDQGLLHDLMPHDGSDPFGEAARRNRSIRQLLLSDGMSESFKVMALKKG
ncbi:class I SAM-dependent methyltransferase [Paenibacillus silvisoli]|uniref:class I SAM-dependent methyltransferase n=1 Tax=Paenibacillus silvisoli TaxID=3110539 RepID=UPI00280600B0|nr:SAM-dependent methyltransferase [Paenibacillus silvisoli]